MSGGARRLHESARWISREFAELLQQEGRSSEAPVVTARPFDVLIVGSGYGAAVCAAELARDGCSVCVLERGREYLPGSFPSRMGDLPGQVRGSVGDRARGGEALFDIRVGPDVSVVLANGLGGGSLINAGVMRRAGKRVFDDRWPAALRTRAGTVPLDPYYEEMERQLGAWLGSRETGRANTIRQAVPKRRILDAMSADAEHAALTIAMHPRATSGGVKLEPCKLCGDCAMGCNYGAKESLDTNLLVTAFHAGAEIYCGATVLRLQRPRNDKGVVVGDRWAVLATHTEEKLRLREGGPRWIAATRVILAAGALGSPEILMRSQLAAGGPRFSSSLGCHFSTNGDMAVVGYNYTDTDVAGALADEDVPPGERNVGPTITGLIEYPSCAGPLLIQEMSVAGPIRRLFEESIATAATLHGLERVDPTRHEAGRPKRDPFAVLPKAFARTSSFAVMGDDGAEGTLRLAADDGDFGADGHIQVDWPDAKRLRLFDVQVDAIRTLAAKIQGRGLTLPNPLWRLLPPEMEKTIAMPRGPLLTVHPLGGCRMADRVEDGVVDEFGRVFDPAPADPQASFHAGLFVLDGSIVPTALAANPALTIAALTLRAIRQLRDQEWQWRAQPVDPPPVQARPWVADLDDEIRRRRDTPPCTEIEVTERLSGSLKLHLAESSDAEECHAEITLTYRPQRIDALYAPNGISGRLENARLQVGTGELRLFRRDAWIRAQRLQGIHRERFERRHARTYAVTGSLTILEREASTVCGRIWKALCAWACNRGIRDLLQPGPGGWNPKAALLAPAFASHAGEVRTFKYELTVGTESKGKCAPRLPPDTARIEGRKRITYERPGNPWRQLQEMTVTDFPGWVEQDARLRLDPRYFAEKSRPLFEIVRQRDHSEALMDIASLGAYFLRMLLSIHFWSARMPDPPAARAPRRLPGPVPGFEAPEIELIEVDRLGDRPVHARLARYRRPGARGAPVVMIHGYSASGTTYAHPSLSPGLAPYLAWHGRDVWVLDMRSSSGMPTAAHPWTMERVALMDIPAAIDLVCARTDAGQVDVVAHCMGAVMLSMAVLSAGKHAHADAVWTPADRDAVDRFRGARDALPQLLGRVVLSQNGPAMVMTDPNIFRNYALSYVEEVLRPHTYHFRPGEGADEALGWALLDRLFATLPYEDRELELENCPPWQRRNLSHLGTRHRMDALYGRTFSLANLGDAVLRDLDDFFGPLSLDTLGQALHFGRLQTIANRAGQNRFVNEPQLRRLWRFPTLVVHGEDNGMADVATLHRIEALLEDAGRKPATLRVPGFGHQDCLIGRDAPAKIFPAVRRFLEGEG